MSVNSSPKIRKQFRTYIVSQNLILSFEYSSGQVDCSCDDPAECVRCENQIFSAQKPQKLNLCLLSTKKVLKCSSVHVQSRCRNTAEVLLTIVRKELTQSPRTILEVHGLIFLLVRIWTKWAHSKTLIFCPRWSSGHMNRKSDNPL